MDTLTLKQPKLELLYYFLGTYFDVVQTKKTVHF
jgi:hypothetical protein